MWKLLGISAAALCAAVAADRPDLSGTWKSSAETLEIQQKDNDIQYTEALPDGKGKKLEIHCNTTGQECKLKDEQVSFWFNGPMLVMMEQRRGNAIVVKKRFKTSEDGKTLTVEVIHISPPADKSENLTYARQP